MRARVAALLAAALCLTTIPEGFAAEPRGLVPAGVATVLPLEPGAFADVEADVVDVSPGRLVARGHVVVRAGARTLRADEITVTLPAGATVAVRARLSLEAAGTCRPLASAERLTITASGRATLERAVAWPCACGPGTLLRITAPRVTLGPGGRATLHGAALRLGKVPFFWVPWLSVPLDGRGSGLLLPEIAYGGRDGLAVRAGAFVEISRRTDATLHAAWRTGRGFLPEARLRLPGVELWGLALLDPRRSPAGPIGGEDGFVRGAFRASLTFRPAPGLLAGGEARAYSDRRFGEDVSYALSARAARVNVTDLVARYDALAAPRARAWPLDATVRLRAYQDLATGPLAGPAVHALPEARLTLHPLAFHLRRLTLLAGGTIGVAQALWRATPDAARLSDRLRGDARLSVWMTTAFGPLHFFGSIEARGLAYHGDLGEPGPGVPASRETLVRGLLGDSVELRLPLARLYRARGGTLRHELAPYALLRAGVATPGAPSPAFPLDDLDRAGFASAVAAGLVQRFLWRGRNAGAGEREILRTEIALIAGPGLFGDAVPALLAAVALGGSPAFGVRAAVVYELDGARTAPSTRTRPAELRLEAGFALPNGARFLARYAAFEADGAGRLFRDDPRSPLYLAATPLGRPLAAASELTLEASSPLGPLLLSGGIRLDVRRPLTGSAGPGLVVADASLSWRARCGCLGAALRASYAPGQPAPDVGLVIDVAPFAMAPPG